MTYPIESQTVVVVGGSSGIGLATARLLVNHHARVTITGRDQKKLQEASQATPALRTTQVDSADRLALDAFFQEHGPLDHLVITLSGGKGAGHFSSLLLQDLRDGFEAKFWPQLNTLQAALPCLKPEGSVTLVTAVSATARLPGTSGLAALNGSLEAMIPVLARELKPRRINAVSPGVVDTPWWDFLPADSKQQTFDQFAAQIPVGRVARPQEIADAILFLIGNTYMSGQVVPCDGGLA